MQSETKVLITISVIIAVLIGAIMYVGPRYKIYRQDLVGQANLRQQEWEKKILVEEAKALLDSSTYKAEAEVERAKGVAAANEIIGDSLKGNSEYLKYLYIDTLEDLNTQVIYIPTEAGIPILEAKR